LKKFIFLTFGFILIILSGYYLNETIKKITAKTIGYESRYVHAFVRCMFHNDSLNNSFLKIRESYRNSGDTSQSFRKDKEWLKLVKINERDYALIESSGNLFTLSISLFGLLTWLIRRKKKIIIKWFDWIFLILSLFFLRETVVIGFDLTQMAKLCDEAKFWDFFGLHWFVPDIILFCLGIILLGFIIFYVVPKNYRLSFFLSGFFGSILSFFLIVRYVGPLLK